ncbi:hypothetical protein HOV23_gp120 [Pseudomonas phage Lana]|uniref:Uncharacterized protein n=1 Tax=Pseudomonas phage Lana TaxID=2530172 RepID=A0A481W687_9CAUD|nr:hypothetical protein HOV23_gp120 [Pseudomonas phage Lana]QBJ04453.1 hypothetical protein [Pseudomonas phage Lana]
MDLLNAYLLSKGLSASAAAFVLTVGPVACLALLGVAWAALKERQALRVARRRRGATRQPLGSQR